MPVWKKLSARELLRVAVATVIALLVIRMVGSVIGLATDPAIKYVYDHANRALPAAAFVVNIATAFVAIWVLSSALRRAARSSPPSLLERNAGTLEVARLAAIIVAVELTFSFLAQAGTNAVMVRAGGFTRLDFWSGAWVLLLGIIVPAVLLVLALVYSPRWFATAGER